MKKSLSFLVIVLWSFLINAQSTPKNVLFIGNSLTYYNSMPQTFESIANSKGDDTAVTVYAPGGSGFVNHVDDANVYAKFREKIWDYVVLQPGSSESYGSSSPIATTLARANRLKDSIIKYSPCAKILYYEISNGVNGSTAQNLQQYNDVMTVIRGNLETLADGSNLFFAPVGEAFREKWNDDQTDMLWGSTGNIHPNAKGSYLAACVFYASIYQKASLGTSEISSLTQTQATALQQLADNKVLNNKADWRINTYNLYTNFDFTNNELQVSFNNQSTNADSVLWDFGDGNTSTDINPTHQYATSGSYQVTLTATKGDCDESVTKIITTSALDISESNLNDLWNIFPNPVNDKLFIKTNYKIDSIAIYTINGVKVVEKHYPTDTINLDFLQSGMYMVKVIIDNKPLVKKFIKI